MIKISDRMSCDKSLQDRLLGEYINHEDDSDDEGISQIPMLIEYITGFRSDSNIVWAIEEENLYYRGHWNATLQARVCTCYDENCLKKIYIREDGTAFELVGNKHDNDHGKMYRTYKHMYCFNLIKQRCLTAPASMSIKVIYDDVVLRYVRNLCRFVE